MSNQIDKAFVQQYRNNLIHLSQQKGSRLRSTVMSRTIQGKYDHYERIGAVAAVERTVRHGDTPILDVPHSRRRVILKDYHWGAMIDDQDKLRMLIDPKSDYVMAGANALGRYMDDVIIAAATGNSISIDADDADSNVAFDSGMIVDEDFGAADSNLTFEKLNETRRLLLAKDIDDENFTFVVNASALASLLTQSEIQSIDTNTVRALVHGTVNSFMGFNFVRCERLPGTANGTDSDPKICLAYAKSAIGLSIGDDLKVKVAERPDKQFNTQIYNKMSIGATRIEEEKIVQVQCVQAS